jgi:hypothetical protein
VRLKWSRLAKLFLDGELALHHPSSPQSTALQHTMSRSKHACLNSTAKHAAAIGKRLNSDANTPKSRKRKHSEAEIEGVAAEPPKKMNEAKKQKESENKHGEESGKKPKRGRRSKEEATSQERNQSANFSAIVPKDSTPSSGIRLASPTKSLLKKTSEAESASQRKSVSFASDVKATDGDSIKQLYLALDPFGKNRTRGGISPAVNTTTKPAIITVESKGKENSSPSKPQPPEKAIPSVLKAKKQKEKHRGGSNSNGSSQPYLGYLSNFHKHRALWKFEKAKQNWILRNALDAELIPESHEAALAAYVNGLQGAGARDRLLEEVKKALKEETVEGELMTARAKVLAKALGRKDMVEEGGESESSDNSSDSDGDHDVEFAMKPKPRDDLDSSDSLGNSDDSDSDSSDSE